jgi:hypothetical protein
VVDVMVFLDRGAEISVQLIVKVKEFVQQQKNIFFRIFFAKSFPHLYSSAVGFCAVEVALGFGKKGGEPSTKPAVTTLFRASIEKIIGTVLNH